MPLPDAIGSLLIIQAISKPTTSAANAHGTISHGFTRICAYIQRANRVQFSMPRRYRTTRRPDTKPTPTPATAIFHFIRLNNGIIRSICCALLISFCPAIACPPPYGYCASSGVRLPDCLIDRFGSNGQPRAEDPLMDDRFRRIGHTQSLIPTIHGIFGRIGH